MLSRQRIHTCWAGADRCSWSSSKGRWPTICRTRRSRSRPSIGWPSCSRRPWQRCMGRPLSATAPGRFESWQQYSVMYSGRNSGRIKSHPQPFVKCLQHDQRLHTKATIGLNRALKPSKLPISPYQDTAELTCSRFVITTPQTAHDVQHTLKILWRETQRPDYLAIVMLGMPTRGTSLTVIWNKRYSIWKASRFQRASGPVVFTE